jgi:SAM-dependent methyltransferase/uncharacterized protein YbaR (Trm112 family)
MWPKLLHVLRCPLCRQHLTLSAFEPEIRVDMSSTEWIDSGLLACAPCKTWFPIVRGVPVLLPYSTSVHQQFVRRHGKKIALSAPGHEPPARLPPRGEELVMRSFSVEWLEYDFDGVIWEMDYADHERRFLKEVEGYAHAAGSPRFLEIGCGLGITTAMAQKNFGGEAVGVDLSLAAWRAAAMHRGNPNLHFVQASVFALPFEAGSFDTIYTRGVLHHTYSTHEAYRALAPLCRPGGALYVWVYGPKSINDNLFRRAVYGVEVVMRFILNRCPAWLSNAALAPFALGYMAFNRARRSANRRIQAYNYTRALHAARDRFTPEFAHRHGANEVCQWFRDAGYVDIEVVDWRSMPSADHDDYRRNTGVRARRSNAGAESLASHCTGEAARDDACFGLVSCDSLAPNASAGPFTR